MVRRKESKIEPDEQKRREMFARQWDTRARVARIVNHDEDTAIEYETKAALIRSGEAPIPEKGSLHQ